MDESQAIEILQRRQAILRDTHVVYTSGRHGNAYINKDAIYPDTNAVSELCQAIAEHFADSRPEVVAAPAVGGVILSQWTAARLRGFGVSALSVYAEKTETGGFAFRRGYDRLLSGKSVLVVEDVLTTGGSLRAVIAEVRALGGNVVGAGVLCNRGNVSAEQVGNPPDLFALTKIKLDSWEATDCPLCNRGVPINTLVGKGREFLEAKRSKSQA